MKWNIILPVILVLSIAVPTISGCKDQNITNSDRSRSSIFGLKAKTIAELKNDTNVEYVQPNFQYYPSSIPTNDPDRDQLWALENTGQTIYGTLNSS